MRKECERHSRKKAFIMRHFYKPNMCALSGRKGRKIMDFLRHQTVKTDDDIKARADACLERVKKLRALEVQNANKS